MRNLLHAGPHGPNRAKEEEVLVEAAFIGPIAPVVRRPKKTQSLQNMVARNNPGKVDICQLAVEVIDNSNSLIVNEMRDDIKSLDISTNDPYSLSLDESQEADGEIEIGDLFISEDHDSLFGDDTKLHNVVEQDLAEASIGTTVIDIHEQFSPITTSIELSDNSDTGLAGLPMLMSIADIGDFKGAITGLISDQAKSKCIVLDMGCADVVIVCSKDFYGSGAHTALLHTISGKRYLLKILVEYFASTNLIARLNNACERKAYSSKSSEVINSTNRFIVLYDDIVCKAVNLKATDIHFELSDGHESYVRLRIYGRMRDWKVFPTELIQGALTAAYSKRTKTGTNSGAALSLERAVNTITEQSVNGKHYNGRFNGYPLVNGYDVVMRLLENDPKGNIPTIESLGYSEQHVNNQIMPAIRRNAGMMVIAGSTGSGKSTALRSFIHCIPGRDELKIYGVEDPTEYLSKFMRQISVQRNSDDLEEVVKMKFLSALRSVLRMDPDVLMLGEIRDHDSASLASEFNRTGHRVFTTVHGDGCVDVLARLTSDEIGIDPTTLAAKKYLSAVMYQKLLPKLCPHCKVPAINILPKKTIEVLRNKFLVDPATMFCASQEGCPHCKVVEVNLAGTKGLTVVAEILMPSDEIQCAIRSQDWALAEDLWRGQRGSAFDSPNTLGKTAFEHALYKACAGIVDPMDIEADFESFSTYQVREIVKTSDTSNA